MWSLAEELSHGSSSLGTAPPWPCSHRAGLFLLSSDSYPSDGQELSSELQRIKIRERFLFALHWGAGFLPGFSIWPVILLSFPYCCWSVAENWFMPAVLCDPDLLGFISWSSRKDTVWQMTWNWWWEMRLFSRVSIRKQIAELNAERESVWLFVFQLPHLTPALEKKSWMLINTCVFIPTQTFKHVHVCVDTHWLRADSTRKLRGPCGKAAFQPSGSFPNWIYSHMLGLISRRLIRKKVDFS